jgi:hypothetical protein
MFFKDLEVIPAHVRDLNALGTEFPDGTFENAEAFDAGILRAFFKKKLEAETNTHELYPSSDQFADWTDEAAGMQFFHGIPKRTDPGQDDLGRAREVLPFAANFVGSAEILQRFGHAAEIAHAVINDSDHDAAIMKMRAEKVES